MYSPKWMPANFPVYFQQARGTLDLSILAAMGSSEVMAKPACAAPSMAFVVLVGRLSYVRANFLRALRNKPSIPAGT